MKKITSRGEELYSNDVFQVLVQYEITRSQRYPSPLGLIQIEMTPTALNESGLLHATAIFTTKLNAHLRSVDIPSMGVGNVFNVLLPTTDEAGTRTVCERLLSIFKSKISGNNGDVVAFSLHIGATCHSGGESLSSESFFQKAGEALKQSQLKGSNTYVLIPN